MPEGPTIVILKQEAASFAGQTIRRAEGNAKIAKQGLVGQRVVAIRSFGKQFLLELESLSLRIHFLMFGSYRVNERKDAAPRLALGFDNGELNFYSCSVRIIEEPLDQVYDWSADVMNEAWNHAAARKKLRAMPEALVCDALLDQDVFAGVGNIIKNEVLFRIRLHPLSQIGALQPRKLGELVDQARRYSFDFLAWKQAFVLKQHWQAHTKTICPRCNIRLKYAAHLGTHKRRAFWCDNCQKLYTLEIQAEMARRRSRSAPRSVNASA